MYSTEPTHKTEYSEQFNRVYGRFARVYDVTVKLFPLWRNWISQAMPHILGPKVLEISFGTGHLLSQYASRYESYGIDYNWEMISVARQNLQKVGAPAALQQADVARLPYRSASFNTVVNTMAFTGYPDGQVAMAEIYRVLRGDGRFVLIDINYPNDHNWLGVKLTQLWASAGDIIRDMRVLFEGAGFLHEEQEVGGFGSVHLYVATKAHE